MATNRVNPQSKEALLKSYNIRLKEDVRSMLENFEGNNPALVVFFLDLIDQFPPHRNRQTRQRRIRIASAVEDHPMRAGHVRDAGAGGQHRSGRRIADEARLRHQTVFDPERFPFGQRGHHRQLAAVPLHAARLRQETDDIARRDGRRSVRSRGGILHERVQVRRLRVSVHVNCDADFGLV